ncbi:MAG: DUF2207 domain-containing protein [Gammaproteobacteria bacterium]|nr:DUF2207 domain-containing protein [Gammaproteobacteria bacterium]
MTITLRLFLTLALALCLNPITQAQERILSYHSEITVELDGSMLVEERIRVRAEGNKIKRGIYRDFPTKYQDHLNNRYQVKFKLLGVTRDGADESYHTKPLSNGIRIYAGRKEYFLPHGEYSYVFSYRTDRQLGFFKEFDELYWNTTGNGWEFPINQASARVNLPPSIPVDSIRVEGYTGPQGSKGQDYTAQVTDEGAAQYATTSGLNQHEGLTIVASWPKGYVTEPSDEQRLSWFLQDNRSTAAGAGGIALLLLYYLFTWHRVGRDPESGVIIPLYKPTAGYSPASMRFISRMGHDNKAFSAAIINMAVKGYLEISESSGGEFTLSKTENSNIKLAIGEGAIASSLFGDGGDTIVLKQENHKKIAKALKVHKRSLKGDYEKNYFITNQIYLLPGILLSIATMAVVIMLLPSADQVGTAIFMSIWLSIWSIGVFALLTNVINAWRGNSKDQAVFLTLLSVPFIAGEIGGIIALITQVSIIYTLALGSVLAINVLFYQWLKAPTLAGRRLMDRIDGFKLYLAVAEKDELNFKHPPEKTPELFEQYLPYAIALDVEQQWAERFSDVLSRAMADNSNYHPGWYHGRSWNQHNLTGFTNSVGSAMSSAISSSSSAPGSSSGGGGGGSSGGGGGGGGGGGW